MAKILLVDDSEPNRDMLAQRLQRKGHKVLQAVNGRQAVEMTRNGQQTLTHVLSVVFFIISMFFVHRSFYADYLEEVWGDAAARFRLAAENRPADEDA